ncbi:hypothetical protein CAPTEDRAFT_190343 [Capitella teleta]|uniref:G-protein coupled receptors family 1 profile domain-containing protein n=1 Tax=Capitella teleta TaxID=283909 RepID=R7V4J1_CAPTE|nr:hypothetical protein CAPTEDRAFT_190343 [Capitella teleta]|eukprot:ELU13758.1 hypothetical protein CAPTEDRAFT_190343 [Capitella teleta]
MMESNETFPDSIMLRKIVSILLEKYNITGFHEFPNEYMSVQLEYFVMSSFITYVLPVIVGLGSIGNLLAFAVLQTKKFRTTSVGFVLSALMVVDTLVLLVDCLPWWLAFLNWSLEFATYSKAGCVLSLFKAFFLIHISAWSLALLTAERLVIVVIPMKGRQWCSRRRMITAWCIVVLLAALLNSHVTWNYAFIPEGNVTTGGAAHASCSLQRDAQVSVFNWLVSLFLSILPAAFLFVANIVILLRLMRSRQLRRQISNQTSTNRVFDSTTIMLFTTSITFLVLTGPYVIVNFVWNYVEITSYKVELRFDLILHISIIMLFLNSAINFLLYCVSGSQFRMAFKDLFRKCRSRSDPVLYTMETRSVDSPNPSSPRKISNRN